MTELLTYPFFRYAAIGLLLTSIVTGLVGSYVVARRMVFIAGGITHSSFAGLGLGSFLGWHPIPLAVLAAVLSGVGVEYYGKERRLREDSLIAAVWAVGMAIGVIFTFLTPGYSPGLSAFLFGNILLIGKADLVLLTAFVAVSIPFVSIAYNQLLSVSFDSEFAQTRGLRVRLIRTVMMIWICVGIVLSIRSVGIMMLMSMLTLPQTIIGLFTADFRRILVGSILLSIGVGFVALWTSFYLNLPTGAVTIFFLAILFFVCRPIAKRVGV